MDLSLLAVLDFVIKHRRLVLGTVLSLSLLLFTLHYLNLRKDLRETKASLVAAQEENKSLRRDMVDIVDAHKKIAGEVVDLERQKADLVDQLERRGKRSISELARAKRGLVEKAINRGTAKALKCVETVAAGGRC